jgi:hypothetical protein
LTDAIATLEQTERSLETQLDATREAIAALRKVAGVASNAEPRPSPNGRHRTVTVAATPHPRAPRQVDDHVLARRAAILQLIAGGTKALSLLRAGVPRAGGMSATQHDTAVRNTLTRLRTQGLIVSDEDGWSMTPAGRKAAKEAP